MYKHGLRWLLICTLVFVTCLSGYVYYIYNHTYNDVMTTVDSKLLNAATSVRYILGEDYHDHISGPNHIDRSVYLAKAKQLSEFAAQLELEYVYSMVLVDGKVHFASSSYTNDDLENNKLSYFYDIYHEATDTNRKAFYSTEPVYEYSQDKWGHFKSIFIPYYANDGTVYLTGADITIKDLEVKLEKSVQQAIITGGFFFFIAVILALFYILVLKRNMSTDTATGYPNHIALERKIARSKQLHLQLMILIVNDLEDINSFYGNQIGDQVVTTLLDKLATTISDECTLYRLSNNKIVILSRSLSPQHLEQLVSQFNQNTPIMSDPFIYLTLCAGVAKGNKEMLLENAHIAALQAKQSRQSIVYFSAALDEVKNQYQHNIVMAKTVRDAFELDRLQPHFQAVFDIRSKQPLFFESLARIHSEDDTLLLPDDFLSVINRSRMDGKLTQQIFKKCAHRFRDSNICWSMNITAQDVLDPMMIDYLISELKRYPRPANITFELIETEAIANFNEARNFIDMVRNLGCKVFVDDFGTGYSNISNILKLNVDGVKLDGSLVSRVTCDKDAYLFVKHLVQFTEQVKLVLVAECVENKLTADKLIAAGVRYLQGYYYSSPQGDIEPTTAVLLSDDSIDHSPNIFVQKA